MRVAVVILAGGEGRRIGGGKPFRLLGGRPLIDHALDQARRWSDRVAISAKGQMIERGVPVLEDDEGEGPIAGIATALRFASEHKADAVLTLPCDTPLLPFDLPDRLGLLLDGDPSAAIPESGGRLHPACGLWAAEGRARLSDYLATGRRSLMGFAEAVGYATAEWPVEPVDPFHNINTPEELEAAEALIRSR